MEKHSSLCLISFALLLYVAASPVLAMGNFIFKNSEYSSQLTVQAFVATKEQLCTLIEDTNEIPAGFQPKTMLELSRIIHTYVFIRIKNTGNQAAWGMLECKINHRDAYDLNIPFINAHQGWTHYIFDSGNLRFPSDWKEPDVEVKWKNLYAK
jgi:hypothetical protein